jgi:four helix bundle protein
MSRISEELRARTKSYASAIIRFYIQLPRRREEIRILGNQLLRYGTSVAAHVREAARARSVAEFISTLDGGVQEADESDLWRTLLRDDCGIRNDDVAPLLGETNELISIFTTMVNRSKGNS